MVKRKITKKELRGRIGFILLAFFTFYLVSPIRQWFETNFAVAQNLQIVIGIIGILITLYFFDF